jgi:hypothetical protein
MGSGFRTFASGEVLTSDNVQNFLMDQAVMVFAGTAARGSALPSPETGMTAYSTATGLQVYDGDDWVDVSTGYGAATGGAGTATITVGDESYTMLTFTGDGTLTVTKAGLFDVLCVGGGGAGGTDASGFGGAGGAGGLPIQTVYLTANQSITIGGGAALATVIGSSSRMGTRPDSLYGAGGGSGGGNNYGGAGERSMAFGGGCGGGGGRGGASAGGIGIDGGDGGTGNTAGGGGGGSTANGGNASSTAGGNGGAGRDVSAFRGETAGTTTYAGGGGGGGASGGTGGAGGGGNRGSAGTANTGGGGGGPTTSGGVNAGAGGSGIVLVRFKV